MISGAENGPGEVTLTTVGDCPSSETLAAYLDGLLSQEERDAVELHLVSCDDCREAMSEASLALVEPQPAVDPVPFPAPTPTPARAARRWLWPTVGLLAAAAVALAVAVPNYFRWKDLERRRDALVAAVGPHRPFEPRLTGGFAYGPLAPVMRSGESDAMAVSPEIRLAAARLAQAYERSPNTRTKAAHAAGELLLWRYDSSISLLEEVTREAPAVAEYWSDLAAAYIVKYERTGDLAAARQGQLAAQRALRLRPDLPEAAFNNALALEQESAALRSRRDALREAWRGAARVQREVAWRQEALDRSQQAQDK